MVVLGVLLSLHTTFLKSQVSVIPRKIIFNYRLKLMAIKMKGYYSETIQSST